MSAVSVTERENRVPVTFSKRLGNLTSSYIFRVVIQGLITIWAVTTFTFVLIRMLPGNPVDIRIDQLQNQGYTYEESVRLAAGLYSFDPNEPIVSQYLRYISNLIQGDLGVSITSAGTPVAAQIMRFLPWTLISVGSALVISFSVGVLLGAMMAYWRGGILDNVITALASILSGIPDYVIAIVIILVGGVQMGYRTVLTLSGSTRREDLAAYAYQPDLVVDSVGALCSELTRPAKATGFSTLRPASRSRVRLKPDALRSAQISTVLPGIGAG